MVLGMPWLARHDPVIDWTKHTIMHFGSRGATVSDDPVGAARAPRGARDPPGETARRAAVSGHPARTPTTERVVGRKCESNQTRNATGTKECPCDVQQVRLARVELGARLRTELFRRCVHPQPAVDGKSEVEMHKEHLRRLFALMRKHKLYANRKKCIFGASEIQVLGCLVGKNGVRPDPGNVREINEWPTPSNVKELRQFLGLATYLRKYVSKYAGETRPLS
ncbi:hypothetical protein PF003_g3061 [Phytophthora fragariae]|nr:hypothetical protein PF003_g3061 [Phytophthora fragariae]